MLNQQRTDFITQISFKECYILILLTYKIEHHFFIYSEFISEL